MGRIKKTITKNKKNSSDVVVKLLRKAQACVDRFEPEGAVRLYEKALQLKPSNSQVMDDLAALYMDLGMSERALEVLRESIRVAPKEGYAKWLYLAQLQTGKESEQACLEGVSIMQKKIAQLEAEKEHEEARMVKAQLCDALCSLAELYMTDLCFDENAESTCERYLAEAMKYDQGSPDPVMALANFRLSQGRNADAAAAMEEMYNRMATLDEDRMPSMEFQTAAGKLLIEVEKYEEAVDVLERVLQEDDENAEIFFLVGSCYKELGDPEAAAEFLNVCHGLLLKLKEEMSTNFHLDAQVVQVEALLQDVQKTQSTAGSSSTDVAQESDNDDMDNG